MSVAASPSEPTEGQRLAPLRAHAGISLSFARRGDATAVSDLEERGGYRAKFPRGDIGAEAVFINTGGGMLGGDRYRFDISVAGGAAATVASQSAERIYRAFDGTPTEVRVGLRLVRGATLAWLPQETILFNGARLARHIDVDMAGDATLLMCEAVVFGRAAMGEMISSGAVRDRWSVRRDGQLVFAEAINLDGNMHAALAHKAIGDGGRAAATLLYIAPDAEERRDGAREALGETTARVALSAWNGLLTARMLAPDSATLRSAIVRVVSYLTRRPMPRVWNC